MAVNLYDITVGPTLWRYTSGEFDVVTASHTWKALPINRSDLTYELKTNDLTLKVPDGLAPFDVWKSSIPAIPIMVTITEYPSLGVKFTGRVTGISYDPMKGIATVKVGSTNNLKDTTSPNRTYGKTCPYELYSPNCGVSQGAHTVTINMSEITWDSPTTFRHSSLGGTGFTNGFVTLPTGESQFIVSQNGNTIKLLGSLGTKGLVATLSLVMGCNKSKSECEIKFGNLPRFGGFPLIPSKNPVTEGI